MRRPLNACETLQLSAINTAASALGHISSPIAYQSLSDRILTQYGVPALPGDQNLPQEKVLRYAGDDRRRPAFLEPAHGIRKDCHSMFGASN